jgi:hypothetical protein
MHNNGVPWPCEDGNERGSTVSWLDVLPGREEIDAIPNRVNPIVDGVVISILDCVPLAEVILNGSKETCAYES